MPPGRAPRFGRPTRMHGSLSGGRDRVSCGTASVSTRYARSLLSNGPTAARPASEASPKDRAGLAWTHDTRSGVRRTLFLTLGYPTPDNMRATIPQQAMATTFKRITLQDWRQFATVTVDFDDRVTILTGANGSGKTTLLNLLARHFGWSIRLISTPAITKKGAWRYYSGAGRAQFEREEKDTHTQIGQITYSDSHIATLRVPPQVSENFHVKIAEMQSVDGIYITSHRPVYTYQRVDEIPTRVNATTELFDQYLQTLRQYYSPGARINNSPSFRLKRSLISLATGAFPISRSRAHTHRRHGHPLQTVPSAGLIERPQEKNRVDALR